MRLVIDFVGLCRNLVNSLSLCPAEMLQCFHWSQVQLSLGCICSFRCAICTIIVKNVFFFYKHVLLFCVCFFLFFKNIYNILTYPREP